MLFRAADLRRIEAGEVQVAFRRWKRPTVRAGGTLQSRAGRLAIDDVRRVTRRQITDAEARRAGRPDRRTLLAELDRRDEGDLWRVAFHLSGEEDPRVALRSAPVDDDLVARVARWSWAHETLALIARHPERRAADLAELTGREKLPFKADVRRLKALGLTESLPVGYRLSPRGQTVLARLERRS